MQSISRSKPRKKDRLQPERFASHGPVVRGKFLVLEGIDGSGTTTQLDRVVEHIRSLGFPAVATREPSTGPIGKLLREALLGQHAMPDGTSLGGRTMAMLFAADRFDHLQREVEPQLALGTTVVSDRYLLSSLAYQAEETEREWVQLLARGVTQPDRTVLLDLPVEVAAKRRLEAGRPVERYDADSYLAKVAANYRALARVDASVVVVDGAGSKDDVTGAICQAIDPLFLPLLAPPPRS
jgi:dTMP kinase